MNFNKFMIFIDSTQLGSVTIEKKNNLQKLINKGDGDNYKIR